MSTSTNKPPARILDSHIHLWPSTSVTSQNHGWMVPGHHLSKRHGIQDYNAVTNSLPSGFIYVETDRYLPRSAPEISASASEKEQAETLKQWASEKLEELKFLRRIVEGTPSEGDGFAKGDGEKMLGTVIWAPFDLSPKLFQLYLKIAEEVSGEAAWKRVVGFRFLLQGKGEGEVKRLVGSEEWVENIASLGSRWGFDVGVDVHRDGVEQLEYVAGMVERVRKIEKNGRVRFILNHLCKPDLSTSPESSTTFSRWTTVLTTLSSDPQITMKLSGAFNEFSPLQTPSFIPDLLTALRPYLTHIFKCFPQRVMFGSDWPVCNVGGPNGEAGNWGLWVKVVETWCEELGLNEEERGDVWWGAAKRAYEVEV